MSTALVTDLTIFVLALLVGFEVIGKVPATLHTPLMSATNAIHGIVLVGAILARRPEEAGAIAREHFSLTETALRDLLVRAEEPE